MRGGICGMPREDYSGRQRDVWTWSSKHRTEHEMWDSTNMFWKLNPWEGGSGRESPWPGKSRPRASLSSVFVPQSYIFTGEWQSFTETSLRRVSVPHFHSLHLLWPVSHMFVDMILSLLSQRRQHPNFQEKLYCLLLSIFIKSFLGVGKAWERRVHMWLSSQSLHRPRYSWLGRAYVEFSDPSQFRQLQSHTEGTEVATGRLSGFLRYPKCSVKNQCQ